MSVPAVTIIVPVYNDVKRLTLCLQALSKQDYTGSFAILVIDNNSSDDIRSVVADFPAAHYLFEAEPGSYAARNRALAEPLAEVVAFTDSDCIPEPNWLSTAVGNLQQQAPNGAIGGRVKLFAEGKPPNLAEYYDLVTGFDQRGYINKDSFAVTANLVTWAQVIADIGMFNQQLKSSGDKDWCRRLVSAGRPLIYSDSAVVRHPARNSTSSIKTKLRRLLGGFYFNHKSGQQNPMFSLKGMLLALLPPFANLKRMGQADINLSVSKQLQLFAYFYYLKLYSFGYRIRLMAGWVKSAERQ